MSNLPTSLPLPNVISSPESVGGAMPSCSRGGRQPEASGRVHVRVNLSGSQAKERGLLTSATFGLPSSGSLSNADLQQSLANKLRARLAVYGSLEYSLTWKQWAINGQAPICVLRASARRISDKDYSGWPTPEAEEARRGFQNRNSGKKGTQKSLTTVVIESLSGWQTPMSVPNSAASKSSTSLQERTAYKKILSGWPTWRKTDYLGRQVHGATSTSSPAETENRGALNPAHSRWLQGYPVGWCQAAIQALRKLKQARKKGLRASGDMGTR